MKKTNATTSNTAHNVVTTTKLAKDLLPTDKLVRFGFVLGIAEITRRIHPMAGIKTVSVTHDQATIDYAPNAWVEVALDPKTPTEKSVRLAHTTEAIARKFAAGVAEYVGPRKMALIVQRNSTEESPSVCRSGDFCDSNVFMEAAFQSVLRRKHIDTQDDKTVALWNAAWDMAKANRFWCGGYTIQTMLAATFDGANTKHNRALLRALKLAVTDKEQPMDMRIACLCKFDKVEGHKGRLYSAETVEKAFRRTAR